MRTLLAIILTVFTAGCSVANVENASYKTIETAKENNKIEVRQYDSLVLASTAMNDSNGNKRNSAFRKLFNYITGDNIDQSKIPMTAPVIMDKKTDDTNTSTEIPMTAPVFMDGDDSESMMSFVLPENYTIDTAPKPKNPDVTLSELNNYVVAAIQFSGRLSDNNIQKHKDILKAWIAEKGYKITGPYKSAGYNAPFTLPMLRRNEVLIPIDLK